MSNVTVLSSARLPARKVRPFSNAQALLKAIERPILIVEDEPCVQAGNDRLKGYAVIGYPQLAMRYRATNCPLDFRKNYDITALKGRNVLIWPTADTDGGIMAASLARALYGTCEPLRILTPDRNDGWDLVQALKDGWDTGKIIAWARDHVKAVEKPPKALTNIDSGKRRPRAQVAPPDPSVVCSWEDLGLAKDAREVPHSNLANVSTILQRHPEFRGAIWYDTFRDKIYHSLDGTPKLWADADTRRVCAWVQQQMQLPKVSVLLVHEAVQHAAECQQRNSLTEWLDSLEWDGVERLDTWLCDCLGAPRNPYNDAVARNWPISMVARAYRPGCQVDTMPVLEGTMGRGKSSFLQVLAEPWFAATTIAFGDKDFFQAIQGRWLIEIPDMSGFSRREHTHILATITTREDVYRKSFGRITEEHPRVTVFAATSETDEYLADARGRRRYWPIRCGAIDLDALRAQRGQIFAEAVIKFRKGAKWHEMPPEADIEQFCRAEQDLWTESVLKNAEALWELQSRNGIERTVTSSALLENVGVPLGKQTDLEKKRIARILREAGWLRGRTVDARFWTKMPERKRDGEEEG